MSDAVTAFKKIGMGVSVFGSARISPEHPFYSLGIEIGNRIAKLGLPLIAGGGPGLMEAANRGAFEAGGRSIGLNIRLPWETRGNKYQTDSLYFEYFNARKSAFFMHSLAYVVLPGGFGTLDELFEAITLVKTLKHPPAPIILVGTEFWSGLMEWIKDQLLKHKMIGSFDLDTLSVCDDPDEVMQLIKEAADTYKHREPTVLS